MIYSLHKRGIKIKNLKKIKNQINHFFLQHNFEKYKNNKKFIYLLAIDNPKYLKFASDEIKNDKDFIFNFLKNCTVINEFLDGIGEFCFSDLPLSIQKDYDIITLINSITEFPLPCFNYDE